MRDRLRIVSFPIAGEQGAGYMQEVWFLISGEVREATGGEEICPLACVLWQTTSAGITVFSAANSKAVDLGVDCRELIKLWGAEEGISILEVGGKESKAQVAIPNEG